MNGGAGADTFRIEGDYGFTVIEDFHSGEDTLDLSWYGAFLPAGYGPSDLIGTASETPAGLLLDVMTIEEPDEIHHSYILLSGIDRTEINSSDVDLWA